MIPVAALLVTTLLLPTLALAVGGWLWGPALWRARRRARLHRRPFPHAWRRVLRHRMPAFNALPHDVQHRVLKIAQVLLAEKPVIGCAGLAVNDEVRVLISAQAALLLLGGKGDYFTGLRRILVYPGAFVVDRSETGAAGIVHEGRQLRAGESWQRGDVVLSWEDVLAGAADPHDGRNVVIHEFAHQLDQAWGGANGAPWLGSRAAQARWSAVWNAEFAEFRLRLAHGESGLIDAYAANSPAEFFAVLSELFFERPGELAAAHAAIYSELVSYYGVDPRHWRD